MFDRQVETLRSVVADQFDEALRSVASYDADGFDVRYIRDDVDELYDDGDYERAFRTHRLEAMDRPTQDSLYAHGKLLCTYRVYEEATEIHVATTETSGVLVSVDADVGIELFATTERIVEVLGPVHSATASDDEPDGDSFEVDGSQTGGEGTVTPSTDAEDQ